MTTPTQTPVVGSIVFSTPTFQRPEDAAAFAALRAELAAAQEALRYIVALMDEARPGMDQGAPAEATARKFVEAFKEAQEARQAAEDELIAWKYRAQVYCDVGNEQRTRANAAVERALAAEARAEALRQREETFRALIADDAYAASFQTLGQFRTSILGWIDERNDIDAIAEGK